MFKKILFLIIIIIFAFACTDNENAIFYYLENEEPEIDDSLNNEISATGSLTAPVKPPPNRGRSAASDRAGWLARSQPCSSGITKHDVTLTIRQCPVNPARIDRTGVVKRGVDQGRRLGPRLAFVF